MEGLIQYVAKLGGNVIVNGLSVQVCIPGSITKEQLFHFAMFIESLIYNNSDLYFHPEKIVCMQDDSFVLQTELSMPHGW